MNWINIYGVIFMLIIMIPNTIYAAKYKGASQNLWNNRIVEVLEQIGRYSCFSFMVVILPHCGFGFVSNETFALYLVINAILIVLYCIIWIVCFKHNSVFKALALSIIPSLVFLLSGVLTRYWLLFIAAIVFAPCHITISYKNAALKKRDES